MSHISLDKLDNTTIMGEKSECRLVNTKGITDSFSTEALCSISVDIDAVAGWLGSYGGEDSPSDISRGMISRCYLRNAVPSCD